MIRSVFVLLYITITGLTNIIIHH